MRYDEDAEEREHDEWEARQVLHGTVNRLEAEVARLRAALGNGEGAAFEEYVAAQVADALKAEVAASARREALLLSWLFWSEYQCAWVLPDQIPALASCGHHENTPAAQLWKLLREKR